MLPEKIKLNNLAQAFRLSPINLFYELLEDPNNRTYNPFVLVDYKAGFLHCAHAHPNRRNAAAEVLNIKLVGNLVGLTLESAIMQFEYETTLDQLKAWCGLDPSTPLHYRLTYADYQSLINSLEVDPKFGPFLVLEK